MAGPPHADSVFSPHAFIALLIASFAADPVSYSPSASVLLSGLTLAYGNSCPTHSIGSACVYRPHPARYHRKMLISLVTVFIIQDHNWKIINGEPISKDDAAEPVAHGNEVLVAEKTVAIPYGAV